MKIKVWLKTGSWIKVRYLQFDGEGKVSLILDKDGDYQPQQVEIVHFMGIKDKNGKEIFEGDILKEKHPTNYDADYSLYRVKFGSFSVGSGDYDDPNYVLLGWYVEGYTFFKKKEHRKGEKWEKYGYKPLHRFLRTLPIIGNEFENKELLK